MSELDADTRARIEAEEAYRAKLRSHPTPPPKKRPGCLPIGCGSLIALFLLGGVLFQCGMTGSGGTGTALRDEKPDYGTFAATCQEIVEKRLKAPTTAKFSNFYIDEDAGKGGGTYDSGYFWTGTVDAENSFGAMLRSSFRCESDAGTDNVKLVSFE